MYINWVNVLITATSVIIAISVAINVNGNVVNYIIVKIRIVLFVLAESRESFVSRKSINKSR